MARKTSCTSMIFFNVTFTCQTSTLFLHILIKCHWQIIQTFLVRVFLHITRLKCNVPFVSICGSTWLIKLNLAQKMQFHGRENFYGSAGKGFPSQLKQFKSKAKYSFWVSQCHLKALYCHTKNIWFLYQLVVTERTYLILIASSSALAFSSPLV